MPQPRAGHGPHRERILEAIFGVLPTIDGFFEDLANGTGRLIWNAREAADVVTGQLVGILVAFEEVVEVSLREHEFETLQLDCITETPTAVALPVPEGAHPHTVTGDPLPIVDRRTVSDRRGGTAESILYDVNPALRREVTEVGEPTHAVVWYTSRANPLAWRLARLYAEARACAA